ncbi:MAG: transglycosylase SLT domain-containing protein [Sulfitobacter sp.]
MKHLILGVALAVTSVPVIAETSGALRPPAKRSQITQPIDDQLPQSTLLAKAAVGGAEQGASTASDAQLEMASNDAAPIDLTPTLPRFYTDIRPPVRSGAVPRTRWQHMRGHAVWTRAALSALKDHGQPLVDLVPRDIDTWCPAYKTGTDEARRAFWVGFMSALAKHESTYKPWAVGGGGRWYGLLQILPGTARGYKCNVGTGQALKNGAANLSCAVRIMAHTVPRDGVIHGYKGGKGRGVTADWGPMHSKAKRNDMARWLRRQNYCKPLNATRPQSRP